jgi:hypothetical protein
MVTGAPKVPEVLTFTVEQQSTKEQASPATPHSNMNVYQKLPEVGASHIWFHADVSRPHNRKS